MNREEHKQLTITGLKWNLVNQIFIQGLTFTIGILMMRILSPSEFGLVGMVTIFSGFLAVFRDFSFGSSLIQKSTIDDLDKNTIFWVSGFLGTVLAALLVAISPHIASFYDEPYLIKITWALSIIFFVQGFSTIPEATLRKQLMFRELFLVNACAICLSSCLAIAVAMFQFGVWALVIQQVVYAVVCCVGFWTVTSWRPSLMLSRERLREHLRFASPMVATQSLGYWTRNMDNLLVGKSFGSMALGLYSRAYSIMMLPVSQISNMIAVVMFPSFSMIQHDKARIKAIYLKICRIIACVTFPLMGILIVVAEPFVAVVFGDRWMQMVPLIEILAVVGAIQSVGTLVGNIFMSQGRTKDFFLMNLISSIIIIAALVFGAQYSMTATAIAYLIAVILILPGQWHFAGSLISCSLREMLVNIWPYFAFSLAMVPSAKAIVNSVDHTGYYLVLVAVPVLYVCLWILLTRVVSPKLYWEFKQLILAQIPRTFKKVDKYEA